MIHAFGCVQGSWQLCLGCGAKVCACHGTGRGTCPLCYVGLLTNYVKTDCRCSFAGCASYAVAEGKRGKQYVCAVHAARQFGKMLLANGEGDGRGQPTTRTQLIARERGIALEPRLYRRRLTSQQETTVSFSLCTILEDCESFDVTPDQAALLVQRGLIYPSEPPAFYHLVDGKTWIEVDEALTAAPVDGDSAT